MSFSTICTLEKSRESQGFENTQYHKRCITDEVNEKTHHVHQLFLVITLKLCPVVENIHVRSMEESLSTLQCKGRNTRQFFQRLKNKINQIYSGIKITPTKHSHTIQIR